MSFLYYAFSFLILLSLSLFFFFIVKNYVSMIIFYQLYLLPCIHSKNSYFQNRCCCTFCFHIYVACIYTYTVVCVYISIYMHVISIYYFLLLFLWYQLHTILVTPCDRCNYFITYITTIKFPKTYLIYCYVVELFT